MKLKAEPCPCGCKHWIVSPLFYCQCSSLSKEEADEVVRRWNAFEDGEQSETTKVTHHIACRYQLTGALESCDCPLSEKDS